MTRLSHLRLAAAALAVLAGCNAEDEPADPVEASEFCSSYALALCEGFQSCCLEGSEEDGEDLVVGGSGGQVTFDTCLRERAELCDLSLVTTSDLGMSGALPPSTVNHEFDAQRAGEALAGIRRASAACALPDLPSYADLHTLGQEGSACRYDDDCEEAYVCNASGTSAGACAVAPREGEDCVDRCASGLQCFEGVCAKPRREGQSCEYDGDCANNLYCSIAFSPSTGVGDGVCVKQRENGESCEYDSECASHYCAGNVVCQEYEDGETIDVWCYLGGSTVAGEFP